MSVSFAFSSSVGICTVSEGNFLFHFTNYPFLNKIASSSVKHNVLYGEKIQSEKTFSSMLKFLVRAYIYRSKKKEYK
jgi:hypothetical protein